jgi:hypothetical protein
MSTAEHTPEPWTAEYHETAKRWYVDSGGNPGQFQLRPTSYMGAAEMDANARRIVACVNACKGIPTSVLEELAASPLFLGSLLINASDEYGLNLKGVSDFTASLPYFCAGLGCDNEITRGAVCSECQGAL